MTIRDPNGNSLGPRDLGSIHYEYDHYAGSNIVVYFGDIIVDDIQHIQFDVQQTRTPVYGYANQYYTFVADGHVFVQGQLSVAFKEAGYLLWPIMSNVNQTNRSNLTSPRYKFNEEGRFTQNFGQSEDFSENIRKSQHAKFMRYNVENAFAQSQDSNYRKDLNRFYRGLSALPDDAFEAWAEEFEDVLWFNTDASNAGARSQVFSNNIEKGTEISKEDVWSHRRADQYPEIDILISYGDFSKGSHNHTVKKLLDVSFIGQSQIIEVSGQPVSEVYNFIARNFV
jgi:hypothetical protein